MEPKSSKQFIDEIVSAVETNVADYDRGDFLRELKSRIIQSMRLREDEEEKKLAETREYIERIENDLNLSTPNYDRRSNQILD